MAIPTSASIGWIRFLQSRPRLQPTSILRIRSIDVLRSKILHHLDLAGILAYAAEGDADAVVEVAIFDIDVCRVLFECDGVVAVLHCPAQEGDVVGVDGVAAVGVDVAAGEGAGARGAGVVDVNVLE